MPRGSTGLDNAEYDNWLAKNKREKELSSRKFERKQALKKDCSGYLFNVDGPPVKVQDIAHLRKELDKRGLAIHGEYRGKKNA